MKRCFGDDTRISIALMSPTVALAFQNLVLAVLSGLGVRFQSIVQLVSKAVVGLVFLYAAPCVWRRSRSKVLTVYLVAGTVFLTHYLLFPDNRMYMNEFIFSLFFMCMPAFIYGSSLRNWAELKAVMRRASIVVLFIGMVWALLAFMGRISGTYNMSLSYVMLVPAIVFADDGYTSKLSLMNLLYTAVSVAIVSLFGSRGTLLCLCVFLLLRARLFKRSRFRDMFAFVFTIMFMTLTLLFHRDLLEGLVNILVRLGVRSRSLALLLQPGVNWTGREVLYRSVLYAIYERPLLGIGLAGDRLVLNGAYVHNIFIEMIAHYGIMIGSMCSVFLVLLLLRSIWTQDPGSYELAIIWISIGLVPLLVSSSYLISVDFWIMLGLLIGRKAIVNMNNEMQSSFRTSADPEAVAAPFELD